MKKKKMIKKIAKYAIRHNCRVELEAKEWNNKSKSFLTNTDSIDTGLELRVMPGEESE